MHDRRLPDIPGLAEIMDTAAASCQKPFGDAIMGKSDGLVPEPLRREIACCGGIAAGGDGKAKREGSGRRNR